MQTKYYKNIYILKLTKKVELIYTQMNDRVRKSNPPYRSPFEDFLKKYILKNNATSGVKLNQGLKKVRLDSKVRI